MLTEIACIKQRGYFSGVEFNVDSEKNLNGFCDFLLTDSNNFIDVTNPVICIAEMKAAQIFNDTAHKYILGDQWLFITLENNRVVIDNNQHPGLF